MSLINSDTLPSTDSSEPVLTAGIRHIAIIMDGNRRWAKKNLLATAQGHYNGYKNLKKIVTYCSDELNLDVLTVYAFSTENWKRSDQEVDFLMNLFQESLKAEIDELCQKRVKLRFLGDLTAFSPAFQKQCAEAVSRTQNNSGMVYQIALNYGGRLELVNACKQIANAVQNEGLNPESINEATLSQYLYTGDIADPDLLIRTGGESRLSNFLLWQAAYAEIYITDAPWPEFTPDKLDEAIAEYQQRQRRFGK